MMVSLPDTLSFALNTEMRWCALQAGWIYVRQHPHDARLSVEELHDWTWGGSLFKPCAPLCSQPAWNTTILVQAAELASWHAWSAHYILHSQCSWPPMARTSMPHLPWQPWMQFQLQQSCIGEPSHCRLVPSPSHPEVHWSIQFFDLLFTRCSQILLHICAIHAFSSIFFWWWGGP